MSKAPGAEQADKIAALCGGLGDAEGLERVVIEMRTLCEQLEAAQPGLGRQELMRLDASLAVLSSALFEMDRIVRKRISELGGGDGYGG